MASLNALRRFYESLLPFVSSHHNTYTKLQSKVEFVMLSEVLSEAKEQ
ncbi:hypothetical protein MC7420_7656 [Coleofasciculus chthonoplastes PCC 7420]|uniref:Uncharacterized protein n=1 Tax=Coleofasciculus chthonoplastes PCC 7420 TaxID=118168 RepID=B4VJI9_9CYAN|nr:hypothetical protein MC7420_7656 [Coleofasciculus chthonoplastes PCC 7420]